MAEKAPWPDSTPEEDAAYALEAQMWDIEFKRDVVEQGGPQLAEYVDPEKAQLISTGGRQYSVQGLYRPKDEEQSIMEIEKYAPLARELERTGTEAPGPDTAAVVGGHSATPQVWAHEFGHRRQRGSERWRLMHDAFRSNTPTEWADAVLRWKSWNRSRFNDDPEIKTYRDVEQHLKEAIATNRNYLLDAEVDARKEEGDAPKKREGFFTIESLRKDQEEQMEFRAKSWSIQKYNEDIKRQEVQKASGGKVTMPSKSPEQARLMHAVASGWKPSRMKSPPSRAVAQEFVEADKKYSGGFAENRYARGGLAFMNQVDSNSERARPLRGFQFGGGTAGIAGAYRRAQELAEGSQDPEESPWGTEAGTTQEMLGRMGYSGPMGYIGVVSGLRQAGWTPAPGGDPEDLRNTMWYPPEQTLTGGDGEGGPPPRIIPTDPASYVGGTASGTSDGGGGGGGSSGEGSEYRQDLRKHQNRIENILGSARGGHVNYYEEGGAVRPGHAEGPNPYPPDSARYRLWERENHIDPPPPPKAAAEPEEIPWWKKLAGYGTPSKTDEELAEMGEARGGRVNYQAGGLAIAAPAGGVPPWVSPTGSGPGYMDEPPPGYQFGGIADRFNPPAAAPPAGPAPAMAQAQSAAGSAVAGMGGPRGGVMGGQYRGVPPQRGMISRGAPPGGLAAMLQQTRQQQTGAAGRLPPGIDPRAVAADREGWATHQADPRFAQQQEAQRRMDDLRTGGVMGGPAGGGTMGRVPMDMQPGPLNRTPSGEIDLGGGRTPEWGPDGPVRGRTPPFMPKVIPWNRPGPAPERVGGMGKPRPGPGMMPPGDEGGGIPGGPRVPPNMRGYLQRQRMMNRPPANVGGGANRVGMQDQQGALSRAMQRGTGRPPMSRRAGFGRAGRRQ